MNNHIENARKVAERLNDSEFLALLGDYDTYAVELPSSLLIPADGGLALPDGKFYSVLVDDSQRKQHYDHVFWGPYPIHPNFNGVFLVTKRVLALRDPYACSTAAAGAVFHELYHARCARERGYATIDLGVKIEEERVAHLLQIRTLKLFPEYLGIREKILRRAKKVVPLGSYLTHKQMVELVDKDLKINAQSIFGIDINIDASILELRTNFQEVYLDIALELTYRCRGKRIELQRGFIKWYLQQCST